MSVEAEESLLGPDETGETEPHLMLVPDLDTASDEATEHGAPRGFAVVALRVGIGVLSLVGLLVLGFVQAFGGPGLLIAGGAAAAAVAALAWSKSGRKNKAGNKARAGETRAGKRASAGASGAGHKGASKGASGGLGKRLAWVLPKRSGGGQKRGAGSASGGKPKASKLGALGKRLGGARKAASGGASKLTGKRSAGRAKGASGKRLGVSKLNPFKRAGKASKGASGSSSEGSKKRSGGKRGSGVVGTLAKPFKAGRAKLTARKAARTEAASGGTKKRSRGPVGAAWKASRTGSPRKVWRAARKSVATRGRVAKTLGTPLSMVAGISFLAGRWAWRTSKRRATAWWATHQWQVRNGFRKASNKVRSKLGRNTLPLLSPPTPVTDPLWDEFDDDTIPVDIPQQSTSPEDSDPSEPWDCTECGRTQGRPQTGDAGTRTVCDRCLLKRVTTKDRPTPDNELAWFVANQKENTMSLSEAPLPDEDAGMLEQREFIRREQAAGEDAKARAKQVREMVASSPYGSASREAGEAYADLLEMIDEAAEDWALTVDSEHAEDFERLESPRVGEPKWDVSNNDI